MEYLKPMAYQNGYALATTQKFAKDNHLTKMSDLNRVNKKYMQPLIQTLPH